MQPTYVPLLVLDANRRTEAHLLDGAAKRGPRRCTVLDRTWYKASWTFLLRPPGGGGGRCGRSAVSGAKRAPSSAPGAARQGLSWDLWADRVSRRL